MRKNPLISKGLAVGIILLFIWINVIPAAGQNIAITTSVHNNVSTNRTGNWTQIQKLLSSDGQTGDRFGYSVSIDGDTALIGAYWDDDYGDRSGSAYVFTRTGTTWAQQQKLLAVDGAEGDYFGISVSLSGDTALIGADNDDDNGDLSGSAYVFTRSGTTWTQQAKLLASDGEEWDQFGEKIALDGDTALIGVPMDDDNGEMSGSAYVFIRVGTVWYQTVKLLASDGTAHDEFGCSVSLSGNTAIIGAGGDDDNGDLSGSAYVFTRSGTTWTQQAKLLASDGTSFDGFGSSVSLSGDIALIGAIMDEYTAGSAYVFTRSGTTWTQQDKLLASDGAVYDNFGWSVSLNGHIALIGAPYDDDNGTWSGSAYVFSRNGTTWSQQAKLLASDGAAEDMFGFSVSLDGDTALIGAYWDDDNGYRAGSAYVFITENQPPLADFSWIPQNPSPNQQITFDASASHDPDGTITLYEWDWNSDGVYDESHTSPTANYSWSQEGTYPVTLRVTDNASATDTVTKTVSVQNLHPVADFIWLPSDPLPGDVVLFDASSSYDPDGYITLYEWDWNDDGTYEETHTNPTATHVWTIPGSYVITLRVTDNEGATSVKPRTLIVVNHAPPTPFITGPPNGTVKHEYAFSIGPITDPEGDSFYVQWDWGDGNITDWLGPFASGQTISASHTWTHVGVYEIRAKLKDTYGAESDWSDPHPITILDNRPPGTPSITGTAKGKPGVTYLYVFNATDTENDDVFYYIDWGDSTNTGWLGPYPSGVQKSASHSWSQQGTYTVKIKAKDTWGSESDWGTLSVTMPCSYNIPFLPLWEQLFERFPHAFPILRRLLGY